MPATQEQRREGRAIGIDYSLTGPAMCIHPFDKPWSLNNCQMYFLTKRKALDGSFMKGRIHGKLFRDYSTDLVRFMQNAIDMKSFVSPLTLDDLVAIEGYAFGARGMRIFQIGEATGILIQLMIIENGSLLNKGRNVSRPAPGEIKKFATGKGNCDKDAMYEAFVRDTGIDLSSELHVKSTASPVNDLVDAYWICKHLHSRHGATND